MPIAVFVFAELVCRFGRAICVQIGDDYLATGFDIAPRNGMTNAASGAGDQSNLAIEFHGPHSSGLR